MSQAYRNFVSGCCFCTLNDWPSDPTNITPQKLHWRQYYQQHAKAVNSLVVIFQRR